jgi:transcriptional regulator with XRE-family HTH domain
MAKSIHRPEYEVLRELLREARLSAGLTQVQLSASLGRPQSYVSDLERGVRRLDLIELRDICAVVGRDLPAFVRELERGIARLSTSPNRRGK